MPPSQEVPSLIYQLAQASNQKHVELHLDHHRRQRPRLAELRRDAAAPRAASAGFTQMPFTFVFNGSFIDLDHLFQQLNGFTTRTTSGGLQVSGRLLTIQGVKLAPATVSGTTARAAATS